MKKTLAILAVASILPTMLATAGANAAIKGSPSAVVVKLNGEGFRACKNLGNSGYTAIAQGDLVDGQGGGYYSEGNKRFRVRNCFETQKSCKSFVNRIENIIPGVEAVNLRSCKPS